MAKLFPLHNAKNAKTTRMAISKLFVLNANSQTRRKAIAKLLYVL